MKLFKKQKRGEGARRVFGFLCSPELADAIRATSKELTLPYYATAEHCLETGLGQVIADIKSEDTRAALHNHLVESHFLALLFKAGNNYDQETSIRVRRWQLKRWDLDKVAHELVSLVDRANIPPSLLVDITKSLVEDAKSRRIYHNRRQGGTSNEEQKDA